MGYKKIVLPVIASIMIFSLVSLSQNFNTILAEGFLTKDIKSIDDQVPSFSNDVEVILKTISGKGQKAQVNNFMTYPGLTTDKFSVPLAQDSIDIVIDWGADINAGSFEATRNRTTNVAGGLDMAPSDGGSSTLTVDLVVGKNVIKMNIDGQDPPFTGRTSNDKDTLTITRGPKFKNHLFNFY